ncbi:hypothetical protein GCM10022233_12510 [Streptomyces shaanxiensis]|uniref:Uncharacterized protein n=1 Tax=Streptomyces shaanxiensis TaxID=653357 RepID=A0ABP7UJ41_9ACTN
MAVVARPIADPTIRAISTRLSPIESSSSWYASRIRGPSLTSASGVPGARRLPSTAGLSASLSSNQSNRRADSLTVMTSDSKTVPKTPVGLS